MRERERERGRRRKRENEKKTSKGKKKLLLFLFFFFLPRHRECRGGLSAPSAPFLSTLLSTPPQGVTRSASAGGGGGGTEGLEEGDALPFDRDASSSSTSVDMFVDLLFFCFEKCFCCDSLSLLSYKGNALFSLFLFLPAIFLCSFFHSALDRAAGWEAPPAPAPTAVAAATLRLPLLGGTTLATTTIAAITRLGKKCTALHTRRLGASSKMIKAEEE